MARLSLLLITAALTLAACRGDASVTRSSDAAVAAVADARAVLADAAATATSDASAAAELAPTPCPPGPDDPTSVVPGAATDELTLVPATFTDLPGWADDRHAEAIPAFLRSCDRLARLASSAVVGVDGHSGRARDWRAACAAAARVPAGDHAAARAFFEAELRPYAARGRSGADGKITAYYVQPLRGSRRRHGPYQTPLYRRPPDLVSIDLTRFIDDARGRRIWGRVEPDGDVVPYPTRGEIRKGALAGQGLELLWVDDPVDALFAQIEGSGKVTMDDGAVLWLEFAGKNGRTYRGVGKILRDLGELPPGGGTMAGIRAWLTAHPERLDEIVDKNTSMVFFAVSKQAGAMGSSGVVLTAGRSLAVDRAFVAAATPLWVDTMAPVAGGGRGGEAPYRRVMIAQDTGGGILGAVRGDVYWGDGADAEALAGRMGGKGRYWLMLPKSVVVK